MPPPVAQEVEDPQRVYPRAMLIAAGLVALTYILPLSAVAVAGIPADQFSTGAWAVAARQIGGPNLFGAALALAVVAGGSISGVGMFNAPDDELQPASLTRSPKKNCCPASSPVPPAPEFPGPPSSSAPSPGD